MVLTESKPAFETEIVYVSGGTEMKAKDPRESVGVVAVSDGLEIVTAAPAIGVPSVLLTVPVMRPVVPASAGPEAATIAAKAPAKRRRFITVS